MSKQVLSVSDFATILNLVNRELARLEQENVVSYHLEHLKQSLSELHIEVETPEVEVRELNNMVREYKDENIHLKSINGNIYKVNKDESLTLLSKGIDIPKFSYISQNEEYILFKIDGKFAKYSKLDNILFIHNENELALEKEGVEVKKRSSWQRDMYAVKPIRFEPPMWEDVQKFAEDVRACCEEVCIKNIMQFSTDGVIHSIYFVKSEDIFSIELTDDDEVNETFELSEAGYVLAVNKARMIFLGDENL